LEEVGLVPERSGTSPTFWQKLPQNLVLMANPVVLFAQARYPFSTRPSAEWNCSF
jgi:hypothetical protein